MLEIFQGLYIIQAIVTLEVTLISLVRDLKLKGEEFNIRNSVWVLLMATGSAIFWPIVLLIVSGKLRIKK